MDMTPLTLESFTLKRARRNTWNIFEQDGMGIEQLNWKTLPIWTKSTKETIPFALTIMPLIRWHPVRESDSLRTIGRESFTADDRRYPINYSKTFESILHEPDYSARWLHRGRNTCNRS